MSTFRGMDGSATIAGGAIANITNFECDANVEILDSTVMGLKWRTVKGGMGKWSGSVKCLLDYVTGQKTFIDAIAAATPAGVSAALVLTIATGKTLSGNALLSGFRISQPVNGQVEVEFNFEGDGALAIAWV